jgi:hypothetical protein
MDELIGLVRRSLKRTLKKKKKKKKTKSKGGRKRRTRSRKTKKTKSKGGRKKRRTSKRGGAASDDSYDSNDSRFSSSRSVTLQWMDANAEAEKKEQEDDLKDAVKHITAAEAQWEVPESESPTAPQHSIVTIPALIAEMDGLRHKVEVLRDKREILSWKNSCNDLLQRINIFLYKIQAAHAAAADGEDDGEDDDDGDGDIEDGLRRAAAADIGRAASLG